MASLAAATDAQIARAADAITLARQPCDVVWRGDALLVATYDYVEAEGTRVGGLCRLRAGPLRETASLELNGAAPARVRGRGDAAAAAWIVSARLAVRRRQSRGSEDCPSLQESRKLVRLCKRRGSEDCPTRVRRSP